MNSEELELSLRTEFESYLKTVLAEMRQDATEFQTRINAELDKQKAQFDEAFQSFSARFDGQHQFDDAFRGQVAEHLKMARDEGARLTANAIAEAEKLAETQAPAAAEPPPPPKYDALRDAVKDISSKDTQSAILKSLVQHAEGFASRGAFFIIKSDNFAGWKVFGDAGSAAENSVRDIHFPISSESILSAAVRSLTAVEGNPGDGDRPFLLPLEFGSPSNMYAIPLVARGRAVAVLYADETEGGEPVNREALETLVSVAGLTVELLAASQTAGADGRQAGTADFENAGHDGDRAPSAAMPQPTAPVVTESFQPNFASPQPGVTSDFGFTESSSYSNAFETAESYGRQAEPPAQEVQFADEFVSVEPAAQPEPVLPTPAPAYGEDIASAYTSFQPEVEPIRESDPGRDAAMFGAGQIERGSGSRFEDRKPATMGMGGGFSQVAEPAVEAPAAPVMPAAPKARFSDRPVDLPIEVPDDERRIHNDARRFARLLVSEIKLYNEKKVIEGRDAQDLYDRLREAIDRSREMYDKRVQPPVAAKFDYFHYELVNSLAEGEASKLGSGYPGSSV